MNTYKYVTTQRPAAPGTYPKKRGEPIEIKNFDERIIYADLNAWGYLIYDYPLTDEEMDDYELIATDSEAQARGTLRQRLLGAIDTVLRGEGDIYDLRDELRTVRLLVGTAVTDEQAYAAWHEVTRV